MPSKPVSFHHAQHQNEIGANFTGVTVPLIGANFTGVTVPLIGANFTGVTVPLIGANFTGVTVPLIGANFTGVTVPLIGANFTGVTVPLSSDDTSSCVQATNAREKYRRDSKEVSKREKEGIETQSKDEKALDMILAILSTMCQALVPL